MATPICETVLENGTKRRRSTFYVPLASDCVKAQQNKNDTRYSTVSRRLSSSGHQSPVKNNSSITTGSSSNSVSYPDSKQTPTKSIQIYKRVPASTTRAFSANMASGSDEPALTSEMNYSSTCSSSHPHLAKTKSPVLRVSSKLLSSSIQALEELSKTSTLSSISSLTSSATSTLDKSRKSSTLGSPLSLIRKSSSRKLSRSSSNITRNLSRLSSKSDSQSVITSSSSDTSSNIIPIDQPPNKELIESYVYCSVNEFDVSSVNSSKRSREQEHDVDDGVHSGIVF